MNVARSAWLRRGVLGLLVGFVITALAATYAKCRVAGTPFLAAAAEAGRDVLLEPLSIAFLVAPFVALAILAPVFAVDGARPWRWWFVGVVAFALTAFYFKGFAGSEYALQQRKWTAAALSVGLMPFVSLPIILLAAAVAGFAKALSRERTGT